MARAAHTLFSQTEKDRRADPRSVYRRILSGFYAEQVGEKCSAEPGIGLFDDDDIRDTIKGTAFKDWIDAQNQKMSQELKKADEWFDPESDRLIKAYIGCLFASVRAMAVLSDEDAETIVKAAVPACRAQAEQLRTMFRKYADELARIYLEDPGGAIETRNRYAQMAEKVIQPDAQWQADLLLAIIKERARRRSEQDKETQPAPSPQPEPKPHETPL